MAKQKRSRPPTLRTVKLTPEQFQMLTEATQGIATAQQRLNDLLSGILAGHGMLRWKIHRMNPDMTLIVEEEGK